MDTLTFISEQQAAIVRSPAPYKLINGCAGSHKTDTLIKLAVADLAAHGRPLLFLTLVGSVTVEIKTRLEATLGIAIEKQGSSNHYAGVFNGIPICISNYDAWVHLMLMLSEAEELTDIADCYSEKVQLLLRKTEDGGCIVPCRLKTGHVAGLLLVDEAQDLPADKMQILVNLALSSPLSVAVAGDFLQTLFKDTSAERLTLDVHAMNLFKKVGPAYFDLNICRRCPKAHVDFNNALLRDAQIKYGLPPMLSSNENRLDRPVLFTHFKTGDNTTSRLNAEMVTGMIRILMERDPSIRPADIAIIMAKTKANYMYEQLKDTLPKLYASLGFSDALLHMNTEADGYHNTLDWSKATGRTVMLSVHGDKGKGHRAVFFLGCTEGSVPQAVQLGKPEELLAESLLNVATTRSLQYLFVGFAYSWPSRYLWRLQDRDPGLLERLAYCSWSLGSAGSSELIGAPDPYFSILEWHRAAYGLWPVWTATYEKEKLLVGDKSLLQVKGDISKDFEQAKSLIMHPWKGLEEKVVFGSRQRIDAPFQEDHYMMMGVLAEMLIQRRVRPAALFKQLLALDSDDESGSVSGSVSVIYTEDERLLSCMYDIANNRMSFDLYMARYDSFFKRNPDLRVAICDIVGAGQRVVHAVFSSAGFRRDLAEFVSAMPNAALRPECIWNVCLFYTQLTQALYRPAVNTFLGYFTEEIRELHANIEAFVATSISSAAEFEVSLQIIGGFSADEERIFNKRNHVVGITGRCDIYDPGTATLTEIKASGLDQCSQEWILQTLMYALMLRPVRTIVIVNILKGCSWSWTLPSPMPSLEDVVVKRISRRYNWHPLETERLVAVIRKSATVDVLIRAP